MVLNFWSIVLIASAGQCVFLLLLLVFRPNSNRKARALLAALLFVLLLTNIHNLWYAGRIYYSYPALAGFGRGLTLAIGPLFYLYTQAITDSRFKFKAQQWFHILPYILGQALIFFQHSPSNVGEGVLMVEAFMTTGLETSPLTTTRFVIYVVHLLTYIFLSRRLMGSVTDDNTRYLITMEKRSGWINQVNLVFSTIALVLLASLSYMLISGYYSFHINSILIIVVSVFIYMVAYQAVANANSLLPDFSKKYEGAKLKNGQKSSLVAGLIRLFQEEKVFLNPDLKLADVAQRLEVQPHTLTALINSELKKSFFELLNQYRVREFIIKAKDPEYAHLSIFGIAQETGYKSKSSFNTAFKKQTGVTPSEYLKS